MGIWEEKISLNGLRQCLKGYNEGLRNEHCAYRYGNWKMGDSAYDENWRLSYKGEECVCAVSSGDFSNTEEIDNLILPVEDFLRIYFTIANEYGENEKLRLEVVLNNPEIANRLDLSQALTNHDQKVWEHKYNISIEDDRLIQKAAKKLESMNVILERNDFSPKSYDLEVSAFNDVGRSVTAWFTVDTNGSVESLDKELQKFARSFVGEDYRNLPGYGDHWVNQVKETLKKVSAKVHKVFQLKDIDRSVR